VSILFRISAFPLSIGSQILVLLCSNVQCQDRRRRSSSGRL
jgi:hypothetical protein